MFKLFGSSPFWLWVYLMRVITETRHVHSIKYLHFYCRQS